MTLPLLPSQPARAAVAGMVQPALPHAAALLQMQAGVLVAVMQRGVTFARAPAGARPTRELLAQQRLGRRAMACVAAVLRLLAVACADLKSEVRACCRRAGVQRWHAHGASPPPPLLRLRPAAVSGGQDGHCGNVLQPAGII